jgi:hypothetical protein
MSVGLALVGNPKLERMEQRLAAQKNADSWRNGVRHLTKDDRDILELLKEELAFNGLQIIFVFHYFASV